MLKLWHLTATALHVQVKLDLLPEDVPLKVASQILSVGKAQRLLSQRAHQDRQPGLEAEPNQVRLSSGCVHTDPAPGCEAAGLLLPLHPYNM